MIKYRVSNESGYVEFIEENEAISYCNSNDIDINIIQEIEFDLEIINNSPIKICNDFNISENRILTTDYDILGYHKQRIFNSGRLIEINYYRNFDANTRTYSDLTIKENRDYLEDEASYPYARILNVKWYREDNSIGIEIVNRIKYYSIEESLNEVVTRRSNIINSAKKLTFETLLVNNNFDKVLTTQQSATFLSLIGTEAINQYIQGDGTQIIASIQVIDLAYISQQLKDDILEMLNYDYIQS